MRSPPERARELNVPLVGLGRRGLRTHGAVLRLDGRIEVRRGPAGIEHLKLRPS
jgi:hypothetical protein